MRLVVALPLVLIAVGLHASVGRAAEAVNLTGDWSCCGAGGAAEQSFALTDDGGTLSGTASTGAGPFAPISGSVSGTAVTIVTGPYTGDPSYTATFVGTVAAGGEAMSGTWSSTAGQEGTWSATRGLRKAALAVNCTDLELYSPSNYFQCTAQLGDASGESPAEAPTGTVSFAVNPGGGGGFRGSSICTLVPSETGGASSSCAVDYVPRPGGIPVGEQPPVTASYSGDGLFGPLSASPLGAVAGASPEAEARLKSCAASASTFSDAASSELLEPALTGGRLGAFAPARARAAASKPTSGMVTVGDRRSARRGKKLSRRQAEARALAILRPAKSSRTEGVAVYGLAGSLRAGSVVTEAQLGSTALSLPALHVDAPSWIFWEDLAPLQRLLHPSVVLIISAHGGRVLARASLQSFPLIDEKTPSFVSARKRHKVFYRAPAPAHAVRLSAVEISHLETAGALTPAAERKAAAKRHARRSSKRAHRSDVSKAGLVTLVDHSGNQPGETFVNEEKAVTGAFTSHGVEATSVMNATGLSQAVSDYAAAGKTSVTIYLDGHGISELGSPQPEILLGKNQNGGLPTTQAQLAAIDKIQADQLATIVQEHPDVKFSFIIDSCHSGRFVDPLSLEPNVTSVSTSSTGIEKSWSPVQLAPADEPREAARSPISTPSGTKLVLEPDEDVSTAVSPFTRAMVAALNQAFIVQGSDSEVSDVVKDARTLEPSYDLEATIGETHPSPEPTPHASCVAPSTPEPEPTGGWFTGE